MLTFFLLLLLFENEDIGILRLRQGNSEYFGQLLELLIETSFFEQFVTNEKYIRDRSTSINFSWNEISVIVYCIFF